MAWSFISENIPQPWHQAEFSVPAYLPDVTSTVLDCGTGQGTWKRGQGSKGGFKGLRTFKIEIRFQYYNSFYNCTDAYPLSISLS